MTILETRIRGDVRWRCKQCELSWDSDHENDTETGVVGAAEHERVSDHTVRAGVVAIMTFEFVGSPHEPLDGIRRARPSAQDGPVSYL